MDVADRELQDVVGRLLGWSPSSWRAVSRGYTANKRWVVSDGRRSAFVKAAVDDLTAGWLRAEQRVYEAVSGSFCPPFWVATTPGRCWSWKT